MDKEIPDEVRKERLGNGATVYTGGMRFGLFIAAIAVLLAPVPAFAQSIEGIGTSDTFSISIFPQYPAPMSPVTLSFLSSMIDLTNASMTVTSGGKQLYQGSVRPMDVMLGKSGSVTSVTVTMTAAGAQYPQTIVIQPQDVSIIAEPLSSAPVLYPGKPLVPLEGSTRVVALANFADASGKTIDPSTLSYTWTVDGAEIANSSGIGKQAVIVASPIQYRTRDVSVLVKSQMGNLAGHASLSLVPKEPSVRIYENDPLLGVRFEHALAGSYKLAGNESSLYAVPYSFPLISGRPIMQWFLNGAKAQTGNLITLRPTGTGKGNASLTLTSVAPGDSLIQAHTNLSLLFGEKQGFNFFGL